MDPIFANIAMAVLLGGLGLLCGIIPSKALSSDLLLLGLWTFIFFISPGLDLAAAIVGYLIGWAIRNHKLKKEGRSLYDPDS